MISDFSSSIVYCIKLIYRSLNVMDLSIGKYHIDFLNVILYLSFQETENMDVKMVLCITLYSVNLFFLFNLFLCFRLESITSSTVSCPQSGVYKSLDTYRSSLSVSSCSTGLWSLSIGCEIGNTNELTLSSSCRHDVIPEVQIITSIKGICLASWVTDHRFQHTLVLYDKTKAFCLVNSFSIILFSLKYIL